MLSPETMKPLGRAKEDVDKDKDGEDVSKLESVEVVLMNCNLANNSYQQASKVLLTFVPKTIWSVNYYFTSFTNNTKNYWRRISIYWIMVHWSK